MDIDPFAASRPANERRATDERFMAAAIRLAMRHSGITGTNPSVATLIVRDEKDGQGPRIVGRGITALGGRPHAEAQALREAGEAARGATAYVTLEPCAHHGRTPPCAEALVAAGIARVVSAAADPDPRVNGKGHAILTAGGLEVTPGILAAEAASDLSAYLTRHAKNRPEVTLKMALSADGCLGVRGGGQVHITGPVANRQTHLVRARHDAILIGRSGPRLPTAGPLHALAEADRHQSRSQDTARYRPRANRPDDADLHRRAARYGWRAS